MQKSESIEIAASVERVWEVAAGEFDRIDRWASNVAQSDALPVESPAFIEHQPAGRVCTTPQGRTKETFVHYDEGERSFTYAIRGDAMPGFVSEATNRWTMEPAGAGRTCLTMTVNMQTRGLVGVIMGPMMQLGMGRLLRTNLEELKHYIETGEQHPRKRKASASRKRSSW